MATKAATVAVILCLLQGLKADTLLKRSPTHEGSDSPHDEPNPVPEGDVEGTTGQDIPHDSDLADPQEGNPGNLGKLRVHQQLVKFKLH
uniref:Uncharacterized protein n=1 Tax=Coptotermes formosanus TaxID=36987 RepID=R4V293_COPFO|nr:hypothetical protein [Coptotermes formosanus]